MRKPVKFKKLIVAAICIGSLAATAMVANAASVGKLLEHVVVTVNNESRSDVSIVKDEKGEVEITGSYETLNYKYIAYMVNGKAYLRNEKNDSVEEFYNFDTANR